MTRVIAYFIPRLLSLLLIVTLTFLLMKFLPGDPFNYEKALPKEIEKALKNHYGLNDPLLSQYLRYIKSLVLFDLGPSFRYENQTVNQIIKSGFPVSALLGLCALSLGVGGGILLGSLSACFHRSWPDFLILALTALSISIPSFILGTLMQYFLGLKLGLLPIARWGTFSHLVMPALALAAMPCAFIARLTRTSIIDTLKQDFIRTARMKGVSEINILFKHVLRNSLLPVVTYLGPLTSNILVGSFVVEKIFAIPGLGQEFVNSVLNRDYTLIMGLTVFYSLLLLIALFVVDILYCLLDPRMRRSVFA